MTDVEHLQRAKSFLQQNQVSAAIIELKNSLQRNPQLAEARFLLGRTYLAQGDYAGAEKELRRALSLGFALAEVVPLLAESLLVQQKYQELLDLFAQEPVAGVADAYPVLQAEAHIGLNHLDEALPLLERAEQAGADDYAVFLAWAKFHGVQGDVEQAIDYLDRAIAANAQGWEAYRLRGTAALQQGAYQEAIGYFDKVIAAEPEGRLTPQSLGARIGRVRAWLALGERDSAKQELEFLLQRVPNHPGPKYLRGLLAFQLRDFPTAEDYLTQVLKQVPDHLPSLLLLGAIHYGQGHYEQAEFYLDRYVARAPRKTEAVMLLAATRLKRGETDLAMEALQPALADGDDARLLAMVGKVAVQGGDIEEGTRYLKRALAVADDDAGIRMELANVYLQSGNFDEAIEALEPLAQEKQDARARVLLVFAHLRKQEFDKALSIARELAQDFQDNPAIVTLLGGVYALRGESAAARERYLRALQLNPDFIPARHNLARLYFQQQDYEAARKELMAMLELDRDNLAALVGLAQVTERLGKLEEALQWWEKAHAAHKEAMLPAMVLANYHLRQGDAARALTILEETQPTDEDNEAWLFLLGRVQLAAGLTTQARDTFQRLTELAPESTAAHFALAEAHLRLNEPERARAALRKVLALNPQHLPAKLRLIQLDLQAGRIQAAMRRAREIQQERPGEAVGYLAAGDVAIRQQDLEGARRFYSQAYEKQPSGRLLVKLVRVMRLTGKGGEATRMLQDWLERQAASAPSDDVLSVKTTLAMIYQQDGALQRAQKLYEEILSQQPENVIALNNLSFLYLEQDPAKARQYAERAYRQAPDNPAIQDTLGWVLVQEGRDVTRGVRLLREASEAAPQSLDIQYHLAAALAKQGEREEARRILTRLLETQREFTEKRAARRLLDELQ